MWYQRIDTFLRSIGLTCSTSDYNMYYISEGDDKTIFFLYMDDLVIIGGDETQISWLKTKLHVEFDMTNLDPVTRYLGVEFNTFP
jgi:hypothetical protein